MPLRKRQAPGPAMKRHLVRVGIVVLAVLVFGVLPGYLASRPGFFARYPSLSEQYVPWSTSPHVGVGCEGCHISPTPLARAAFRARMVGEFYLSVAAGSREPDYFERPENEACLECHTELRTSSPKGDLQIPHRAHITILEMDCVECHNYLVHDFSPEGKHAPTMVGCLRCHDGDTARDDCVACHTEKAAPTSHAAADWLIVHAAQAADPECVTCHKWKEDWCADCHRDLPQSHGTDWRAVHGERAGEHRNCEACHVTDFCVRCHGEVPQLNYDPTLELVE